MYKRQVLAGCINSEQTIANIADLVHRARRCGTPVIWVRHNADHELVKGSPGWQIVPELVPAEGEPMPSVRSLAGQYLLNPLTVNRALQALGDEGLLETRRGLGMYVRPGARQRLRDLERDRFLNDEWPRLRQRLRRLGLGPRDLNWEDVQ